MNTKWNVEASNNIRQTIQLCEQHRQQVRQGASNSSLIDARQRDIAGPGIQNSLPVEQEMAQKLDYLREKIT